MSKRERVEDLGRILEMSSKLQDHDIFNIYHGRPKDVFHWWNARTDSEKADFIYSVVDGLNDLSEKICEIWSVARGDVEDQS